jgi:RimJ/RimL family protein N-acetyltransferase
MALNFDSTAEYILEDERVLLRPLKATDYEFLLPFALTQPDTWQYSLVSAKGADGMKSYIDFAVKERENGKEYPFIVFDKQTNTYAGCTRFYDINSVYQTVQLGYTWYGEQFRGTGLNRHCKFLLLQLAFETMNALRVEFRADAANERSVAAMKAIGCTPEGILRNHMPTQDGGRRDSIILSIIKDEWEQSVKQNLKNKLI